MTKIHEYKEYIYIYIYIFIYLFMYLFIYLFCVSTTTSVIHFHDKTHS